VPEINRKQGEIVVLFVAILARKFLENRELSKNSSFYVFFQEHNSALRSVVRQSS